MAAPLPRLLLPDNSVIDDGRLSIGGCDTLGLAAQFGTPLFVYDEEHLRARCREAVATFGDGVAYATKAFLCKAMARLAHREGMHLDVATGGELWIALEAGVPAQSLVLHGNNKSPVELAMALEAGVGRIVVDSFDELHRLEGLAAGRRQPVRVLIRITPGVEAHTHEFVSTGQDDTKFGFTVSTGAAERAIDRARILSAELTMASEASRSAVEGQLRILWRRARLIRAAITLVSMSALAAAILIIVLFFTALWQLETAWLIGALFVVCMACLIAALIVFIHDINQSLAALRLELKVEGLHDD